MGFNDLLKMMIDKDGSDLFLTTGAPPSMKAHGKLVPLLDKKLPEGMVKKIAYQIMNDEQIAEFEKSPEKCFCGKRNCKGECSTSKLN